MTTLQGTAKLHTPEELLAGAESLLANRDSQFARSAVLEALVSLESYVRDTVFELLKVKLSPEFVNWLEKKTKMDFDARLEHIIPLALDREVDKTSQLWQRYKNCKSIRNKVAHTGQHVSREEAREVLATVREWLAYLGSTVEVDLSLLGLKKYAEGSSARVNSERDAIELVNRFYSKTRPSVVRTNVYTIGKRSVDMILEFEDNIVIVETKFSSTFKIEEAAHQTQYVSVEPLNKNLRVRNVIIIFSKYPLSHSQQDIVKLESGVSGVYIQV